MKLKRLILPSVVAILFSSCGLPAPSYSVDSYAGSLDRCLDIEGAYENQNYYRDFPGGHMRIDSYLLPIQKFDRALSKARTEKKIILWEVIKEEKKTVFKKAWITFRVINAQQLEITIFNIEGQSFTKIINMQEKVEVPSWLNENEEFTCNQTSWQRTYSSVSYRESGSDKIRIYSKATKLPNGTLRIEGKYDDLMGSLGLYRPSGGVDRVGYFRKVDLTVDDIRAMNDKAKRAIEQYDQVATTPPQ
jgi:hypothetical protein